MEAELAHAHILIKAFRNPSEVPTCQGTGLAEGLPRKCSAPHVYISRRDSGNTPKIKEGNEHDRIPEGQNCVPANG